MVTGGTNTQFLDGNVVEFQLDSEQTTTKTSDLEGRCASDWNERCASRRRRPGNTISRQSHVHVTI